MGDPSPPKKTKKQFAQGKKIEKKKFLQGQKFKTNIRTRAKKIHMPRGDRKKKFVPDENYKEVTLASLTSIFVKVLIVLLLELNK